ncbi:MAG: DUF4214 domain-containing protein [Acetobacteraceae bacterium]|nr:DUF4214 domain-containing protein [Acetobacteraceae bacterium]
MARVVRLAGTLPAIITENSRPGDWIGNLSLSGDIAGLVSIEAIGPGGSFFSVSYNPALALATITPGALLDYEAFLAAGLAPEVSFSLRFNFSDGTRLDDPAQFRIEVKDVDDTPPTGLAFATGGSVTAGAIGAIIGTLAVTDPDSAGPFTFTFPEEDAWRFEVAGNTLKLRDGVSLGLDDIPHRPLIIEVSDGHQSAAFTLDLIVRDPAPQESTAPVLPPGGTQAGFTAIASGTVLSLHRAETVAAINAYGDDLRQVVLRDGGEVWLSGVQRLQFEDGWFDLALDGPAARAEALHRAILGEATTPAELARLTALLQSGMGDLELARSLLASSTLLGDGLTDADFVTALCRAACGHDPSAAELALHTGRLASGLSRAQLAVDLALSPEALAHLAESAPEGHWVAQPYGRDEAETVPPPAPAEAPIPVPPDAVPLDMGWFF